MKVVVHLGLVPLVMLLAASFSLAQSATPGAEAVRQIDWSTLGPGSPIPEQMPAMQSDDPLEVGFARQWIEHVVSPACLGCDWRKLALDIASNRRNPDDQWASQLETELRAIVRDKVQTGRNPRVFCNSFGCLCYVERDERYAGDPIVYLALVGKKGRELGLARSDLDATVHPRRPGIPWELTVVKRPNSANPRGAPST